MWGREQGADDCSSRVYLFQGVSHLLPFSFTDLILPFFFFFSRTEYQYAEIELVLEISPTSTSTPPKCLHAQPSTPSPTFACRPCSSRSKTSPGSSTSSPPLALTRSLGSSRSRFQRKASTSMSSLLRPPTPRRQANAKDTGPSTSLNGSLSVLRNTCICKSRTRTMQLCCQSLGRFSSCDSGMHWSGRSRSKYGGRSSERMGSLGTLLGVLRCLRILVWAGVGGGCGDVE